MTLDPVCVPPWQTHSPLFPYTTLFRSSANVSAFKPAPESTGLVPDRSLAPAPSAVSVTSATVLVPPLSLTTTLRRCNAGRSEERRVGQEGSWPGPSETFDQDCVPPWQTHALVV